VPVSGVAKPQLYGGAFRVDPPAALTPAVGAASRFCV
jgi:hypothetical protein